MNYQVTWSPVAEEQLAAAWLDAADRAEVTRSANELERALGRNPLVIGEARTSSVQRIAFFDHLGVEYEVIEDDKRVLVNAIFLVGE